MNARSIQRISSAACVAVCLSGLAAPSPAADTSAVTAAAVVARAASKQGTVSLEGADQPLQLNLYDAAAARLPTTFSTYVPADMLVDVAPASSANRWVRFVANFDGHRQDKAYVELRFLPHGTGVAAARAALVKALPSGTVLKPVAAAARQFSWAQDELSFSYASPAGHMVGSTALGRHGTDYFQLTLHYPREYGGGFMPRARLVLDEWRWADTQQQGL
jgi:hypothetical protein